MRRGFALTLSIIILIFFLTLILTVESQRSSIEEQTRANHARMRAISSLLADIDSPALTYSLKKMAKRTLYDLDMKVITSKAYFPDGTVRGPTGEFCKNLTAKYNGYLDSLKMRANDSGLTLTYAEPACDVELIGPFNASVSLNTTLNITGSGIFINKSLDRTFNFSIEGVYDPMLYFESAEDNPADPSYFIMRPIINSSISNEKVEEISRIADADYGQGWAYGAVINTTDALQLKNDGREGEWGVYILYITPDELSEWKNDLDKFAGVIFNSPSGGATRKDFTAVPLQGTDSHGLTCTYYLDMECWVEDSPCINCGVYVDGYKNGMTASDCTVNWDNGARLDRPQSYEKCNAVFESGGKWISDKNGLHAYANSQGENIRMSKPFIKVQHLSQDFLPDRVLINTELDTIFPVHSGMEALDIEVQRGAVLCGNYFAMGKGPDIFSRLEGNINAKDKYGIETFVVGMWAKDAKSKLDHEYYSTSTIRGNKIRGMPGCLRPDMCDDKLYPEGEMTIGRFRISEERDNDYGMDTLIQRYTNTKIQIK